MKTFTDKRRNASSDGGNSGFKMKQLPFMGVICSVTLYIVYRTTNYQYYETQMETKLHPFDSVEDNELPSGKLKDLPRGIMHTRSDLELRPQWRKSLRSADNQITGPWIAQGVLLVGKKVEQSHHWIKQEVMKVVSL